MIFIPQISKGHNSVKKKVKFRFLFAAHRLMMVYISVQSVMNIFSTVYKL